MKITAKNTVLKVKLDDGQIICFCHFVSSSLHHWSLFQQMRLRNKTVEMHPCTYLILPNFHHQASSYSLSKGWNYTCNVLPFFSCDDWSILFEWVKRGVYAINTTKMMKNKIKTANILIISHRFDVTDWKYFKISLCAASTFMTASSVFESILKNK